jgi:hypothetical protein
MKTEMTPEKIKQFIDKLEQKKVYYIVIAGVGLDGKRGQITRPHQDLDILCPKNKLASINKILDELGYSGERYNDLYKVFDKSGGKIDIALVSFEDDEAVTYGRIAITRFPKALFEKSQIGHIDNFIFNIAPNELLKTWGKDSKYEDDTTFANSLEVNVSQMKKIKRVLREKE